VVARALLTGARGTEGTDETCGRLGHWRARAALSSVLSVLRSIWRESHDLVMVCCGESCTAAWTVVEVASGHG